MNFNRTSDYFLGDLIQIHLSALCGSAAFFFKTSATFSHQPSSKQIQRKREKPDSDPTKKARPKDMHLPSEMSSEELSPSLIEAIGLELPLKFGSLFTF